MRRSNAGWFALIILVAVTATWPSSAFAQGAVSGAGLKPEALVGTYQGTAIGPGGGEMPVTLTLKYEKTAFTGTVNTGGEGLIPITGGTLTQDRLVLNFDMAGAPATLTCTVKDAGRLEGNWTAGDASGTVVLTRAAEGAKPATGAPSGAKPAEPATAAKPATGGDPITGAWDGITGNNDMSVPFTLNLKLEGEKVTGDISSDQGGAALNPGVWKDGALSISFDFGAMGTVTMLGALKEGKLVGTMDFAGQMQMSWAAVKK
jgi:hypothetical protein